MDKLKKFRQYHNNSEHMAGNYKFWLLEDSEIAKRLGIETQEGATGDIYIVRQAGTPFNKAKACCNVFGFQFSSEKVITGQEVQANPDEGIKRLQELSFDAPMVVHDEVGFRKKLLGLPTLVIYCDPKIHGVETFKKVMATVSEARKKMPLKVSYEEDKADNEVMFVVSTTNKLTPIGVLPRDKPQALFVKMGKGSQVDVIKEYLPALEKLEGSTVAEFKERAKNAPKEFAVGPGDDDNTQHAKQHMGIVFNDSRFDLQILHKEHDPLALTDSDTLLRFIKESLAG